MSYSITNSSGNLIATVQDATINAVTTSLSLIGRDYAGYGAFLNENFVYLLENFANNAAPSNPVTGQLWYNTTLNTLEVYNSALGGWKPISSSIAASTAPANAVSTVGDLWWNTANNQLYVYSGTAWILIGPPSTTAGVTSGAVVETIYDSSNNPHVVIKFYISNNIVGIVSYDGQFTPQTTLSGFPTINPGFNLATSDVLIGSQFTGDASNALKLNGLSASAFLRSDQNATTAYQITAGAGFVVASDLYTTLDAANNQVSINSVTNNRNLNFYVNQNNIKTAAIGITASTGTVTFANIVNVGGALTSFGAFTANSTVSIVGTTTLQNSLLPYGNNTINIGSTGTPFANVYASTFAGNLNGNVTASIISVSGNVLISGYPAATQNYVTTYVQTAGQNSQGVKTIQSISSGAPSNSFGNNGDIVYQY